MNISLLNCPKKRTEPWGNWINNQEVVILVCLNETPQFINPVTAYEDIKDVDGEFGRLGEIAARAMKRNREHDYYGPIEYRGHKWAGKLNEVFIELWRTDNKFPITSWLIRNARPLDSLPKTIGLKISDFLSEKAWDAAKISDSDVPFDADIYVRRLMLAMSATALERFGDFIF
ncbi:hypothetical protein V1504DRAFT_436653 [Lipomyces starkeyi]